MNNIKVDTKLSGGCKKNCIGYPEVLLQVVDCDWDVFAALFQLNVWESWKGEVQTQVLHWAAVHVQALERLLQGLPRLLHTNTG